MKLRKKTINEIADMICGNYDSEESFFTYRSSSYLTEFFEDCEMPYAHDGSTRKWWVASKLEEILGQPSSNPLLLPDGFITVLRVLMDQSDATNEGRDRPGALGLLNVSLAREGYQAFYDKDGVCQIRNTQTRTTSTAIDAPQQAWTSEQLEARGKLSNYLDTASEDDIIEHILLPLFRQLGFQRITSAGHKDKALEYGKDIWMKYRLPTAHNIYFGIQVKKGKLDAAGKSANTNVAEILNQIHMMLGHTVFDPETNKKSLVDHAIIVAGGEITKQARNWLGEKLNASQRSQILFMERNDLLDLMLINNVPLPASLVMTVADFDEDIPF